MPEIENIFKSNQKQVSLLRNEFNIDNNKSWFKYLKRRSYMTIKYSYLKPFKEEINNEINYIDFRKFTSYDGEISSLLLKYILISERRFINTLIETLGKKNITWQNVKSFRTDKSMIKESYELISKINKKVSKKMNEDIYQDSFDKYGTLPLWIVAQDFDFGTIKALWNVCTSDVKNKWIRNYYICSSDIISLTIGKDTRAQWQDYTGNREYSNSWIKYINSVDDGKQSFNHNSIMVSLNILNNYRNKFAHNTSAILLANPTHLLTLRNLLISIFPFLTNRERNNLLKGIRKCNHDYLRDNSFFNEIKTNKKIETIWISEAALKHIKENTFKTRWK